jgi:lyso-ornithine lipid O-acyltransferase
MFILAALLLITLPLMLLQQLFTLTSRRAARWLPSAYLWLLCKLVGVKIEVIGELPKPGPALIVGNHVSWIDIPIVGSLFPASFIAKREIGTWPLVSHLAKLQGTVFVDRIRRQTVLKSRDQMQSRLKSGDKLVLFPEGTSHDGKAVLPFKSTFFSAVAGLDVPVIPITLAFMSIRKLPLTPRQRPIYAWYGDMELAGHVWEALRAGPLHVKVIFHPALEPAHRKVLARASYATIRGSLASALHPSTEIR